MTHWEERRRRRETGRDKDIFEKRPTETLTARDGVKFRKGEGDLRDPPPPHLIFSLLANDK